jgi:hypothetical protein
VTPAAALVFFTVAEASTIGDPGAIREAPDQAIAAAPSAPPGGTRPPNITVPAVHGLALMTVMRVTETALWPDPFARPEHFAAHYEEAFTRPPRFDRDKPFMQWDGDSLLINVAGHGLFGSELYLRARQCRFGWAGSLAFAAATSALWEYAFEANGVRPSAQDLVYTPLAGIALGEVRFVVHRAAAGFSAPARAIVRGLVDPLGELERAAGTDC